MTKDIDDKISSILNIADSIHTAEVEIEKTVPCVEVIVPEIVPTSQNKKDLVDSQELLEDIKTVRNSMLTTISAAQEGLSQLLDTIKTRPGDVESYEALASLLKGVNESNFKLLEMYTKITEIEATVQTEANKDVEVNNTLIVANPAELISMLQSEGRRGLEAAMQKYLEQKPENDQS